MSQYFFALVTLITIAFCTPRVFGQQIAFTWDDLPAHGPLPAGETRLQIVTAILDAMQSAKLAPAYGFVNGVRLEQEPGSDAVLKAWRAAGYPLGNHTWSHMNLNEHTADEFEHDLEKNESLLRAQMGSNDWRWLRYPYLAIGNNSEKRQQIRTYLAKHHYRVAGVTMSFNDYAWNEPYARCLAHRDTAAITQLENSYLQSADESATYSRSMAKLLYGHDIPYVLLMHVGAMDARMLPRLISLYRDRGFSFISLEEAERNPFYDSDTHLSVNDEESTLEGAVAARHLNPTKHPMVPDLSTVCR